MEYGLFSYPDFKGYYNVGDFIQSLAAKQYLPKVDVLLNKEKLSEYNGKPVKVIMNGWYMRQLSNWPPAGNIIPHFVSMHVNSNYIKRFLSSESIEYLKQHQPIGCRDEYTRGELENHGINAYFSGCLTLTLGETYKRNKKREEVLFVDPVVKLPKTQPFFILSMIMRGGSRFFLKKKFRTNYLKHNGDYFDFKGFKGKIKMFFQIGVLNDLFEESLLDEGAYVHHSIKKTDHPTTKERFLYAEDLLQRYANAKLVITSRIHCALPCLAVGTPVIFLNVGYDNISDKGRTASFNDLFNVISIGWKGRKANFYNNPQNKIAIDTIDANPSNYKRLVPNLVKSCKEFIG